MNTAVMRCYFKATQLEMISSGYRRELQQLFLKEYPDLTHITEQRLIDQKRVIINNKKLTAEEIQVVKEEVARELEEAGQEIPIIDAQDNVVEMATQDSPPRKSDEQDTESNPSTEEVRIQEISDMIESYIVKWRDTNPNARAAIPKLRYSHKIENTVKLINTKLIRNFITDDSDLEEIHLVIYACACATTVLNGQKLFTNEKSPKKPRKPAWQIRLERKIEKLRREIGQTTQYQRGVRTKALEKKISHIIGNREQPVAETLELMKQRLAVYSARLRRYNESNKRKIQNQIFKNNEKTFYRNLTSKEEIEVIPPTKEEVTDFWSNLWSNPVEHIKDGQWIKDEVKRQEATAEQAEYVISMDELATSIRNTHNWKCPGPDNVHNYWYKKFTSVHPYLTAQVNSILQNPERAPDFMLEGRTFIKPKNQDTKNPANYRPITCLPTIYKIITATLCRKIDSHLEANNILSEEQKGCTKRSKGCKEQLIIDSIVMKQTEKNRRNMHVTFIDYRKAFDMVPHSWLLEVLEIYKIHPVIRQFLAIAMQQWKTKIHLKTSDGRLETDFIYIRRGIFQGDALSALWFCLSLNPLSNALKGTNVGFQIKLDRRTLYILSHLMYVDDMKLYGSTPAELKSLHQVTQQVSGDIQMEFGFEKCRVLNIRSGKWVKDEEDQTLNDEPVQQMEEDDLYKYLGLYENRKLNHTDIKRGVRELYEKRLNALLKSKLNSGNLFKAINTFAVPVLTYSFGVIKWTATDLENILIHTRAQLTQFRKLHPNSCKERVVLHRSEGGRGLLDIHQLCNRQIESLRSYFFSKEHPMHRAVVQVDREYTPLNLASQAEVSLKCTTEEQRKLAWADKQLHGRHYNHVEQRDISKQLSYKFLKSGQLFPETEGFILAIQDQVIATRNYKKFIIKDGTVNDDRCRKCHQHPETIDHITAGCKLLAGVEYTKRHDSVAKIIHQAIALSRELLTASQPYYEYNPETVLENQGCKLYWDLSIQTDKTIANNRPDLVLFEKKQKVAFIIDIAVPADGNVSKKYQEKVEKYQQLAIEMERLWKLKRVRILPFVISVTGITPYSFGENLKHLGLLPSVHAQSQKAAILHTCNITRAFLELKR